MVCLVLPFSVSHLPLLPATVSEWNISAPGHTVCFTIAQKQESEEHWVQWGRRLSWLKCLLCRQEHLSFEILSTYPKAAWWHVSVTPMLESCAGGRQVMQDRCIMGAHWLASLAKWMSSRFSKRLCLKNEGDVNNEHINMERKSLTLNSTLDKELQQLRNV